MIDWHCHILPGIDDGPKSVSESIQMARLLVDAGYTDIYCTPHRISGVYDNPAESVYRATMELQEELKRQGLPLTLHAGTEYYLDEFLPDFLQGALALPGNLFLVELPTRCDVQIVQRILTKAMKTGLTPLIAHPERCSLLEPPPSKPAATELFKKILGIKRAPIESQRSSLLLYLGEIGCKFQGNIGSIHGYYGERIRNNANYLKSSGYYACWGTDAHNSEQLRILIDRKD